MRVLGIDPGFDRLGLAILEGNPSKPTLVWSDCIIPTPGAMEDRLAQVSAAIEKTVMEYQPDGASIEKLFFNKSRLTAMGVAEARGAILSVLGSHNIPVHQFTPSQVKMAVTGYGAATKDAVAGMIPRLMTLSPKKRLDDEMDAIAVAVAGLPAIHTQRHIPLQRES